MAAAARPRKLHQFRQRGFKWMLARVRDEFFSPRFAPTRALRDVIVRFTGRPQGNVADAAVMTDTLFFVFDLQVCPIAYDIATYLAAAELERRRLGLAKIHVVIVPGRGDGFRLELPEYVEVVDTEARRWRVENLIIPVLRLLPSCSGYTLTDSRDDATAILRAFAGHLFPSDWDPIFPTRPVARTVRDAGRAGTPIFPMLRATEQGLRHIDRFLGAHAAGRLPVVISLRQYAYTPERNSDSAAWIKFADGLDPTRFVAIFVLDTEESLVQADRFGRHPVMHAAAWNVQLRMALYERAFVNLAVMHGPMELCWYNAACRYVLFCAVDSAPLTGRSFLEGEGFVIGASLPFAGPAQRIVWGSDTAAAITSAFDGLVRDIEQPEGPA